MTDDTILICLSKTYSALLSLPPNDPWRMEHQDILNELRDTIAHITNQSSEEIQASFETLSVLSHQLSQRDRDFIADQPARPVANEPTPGVYTYVVPASLGRDEHFTSDPNQIEAQPAQRERPEPPND